MVIGVKGHAPVRRQMGNDLVDIHIRLGAAARLPDHQGKLLVPLSGTDFLAGGGDNPGLLLRQLAQIGVGLGTGFL